MGDDHGKQSGTKSHQAALDDVRSAIAFHVETYGPEALVDNESTVVEAFVAEASMAGQAVPEGRTPAA